MTSMDAAEALFAVGIFTLLITCMVVDITDCALRPRNKLFLYGGEALFFMSPLLIKLWIIALL